MQPCVILEGNLSEGFKCYGPYESMEEASKRHAGPDVWVMSLECVVDPQECVCCGHLVGMPEGEISCTCNTCVVWRERRDPDDPQYRASQQGDPDVCPVCESRNTTAHDPADPRSHECHDCGDEYKAKYTAEQWAQQEEKNKAG